MTEPPKIPPRSIASLPSAGEPEKLKPFLLPFWRSEERWPMETANRVFLLTAVKRAGPILLGEEWTGDEFGAATIGEVPKHEKQVILTLLSEWGAGYDPGEPYTDAHWHQARQVAAELDRVSKPYVGRLELVCKALAAEVMDGRVTAYCRPEAGYAEPEWMHKSNWWKEDWRSFFGSGQWARWNGRSKQHCWIFLDGSELDRFFARSERGHRLSSPSAPAIAAAPVHEFAPTSEPFQKPNALMLGRSLGKWVAADDTTEVAKSRVAAAKGDPDDERTIRSELRKMLAEQQKHFEPKSIDAKRRAAGFKVRDE